MFQQRGTADELAEAMRRSMLVKEAEDNTHSEKLESAVLCLNKSAELFESLGMTEEAEHITNILEKIASK